MATYAANLGVDAGGLTTPTVPVSARPLTLAAWINLTSLGPTNTIFRIEDDFEDDEPSIIFRTTSSGQLYVSVREIGGGGFGASSPAGFVTAGAWIHVAFVWEADGTRNVYANNMHDALDVRAVDTSGADIFRLGLRDSGIPDLDGQMARPAVWNTALSAGEIALLVAGHLPTAIGNTPVFYDADMAAGSGHAPTVGSGTLTNVGTVLDGSSDPPLWKPPYVQRGSRKSRRQFYGVLVGEDVTPPPLLVLRAIRTARPGLAQPGSAMWVAAPVADSVAPPPPIRLFPHRTVHPGVAQPGSARWVDPALPDAFDLPAMIVYRPSWPTAHPGVAQPGSFRGWGPVVGHWPLPPYLAGGAPGSVRKSRRMFFQVVPNPGDDGVPPYSSLRKSRRMFFQWLPPDSTNVTGPAYFRWTAIDRGQHRIFSAFTAIDRGQCLIFADFTGLDRGRHAIINSFTGQDRGRYAVLANYITTDRGVFRVANDGSALFRIYVGEGAAPDPETDSPVETFAVDATYPADVDDWTVDYDTTYALAAPVSGTTTYYVLITTGNQYGLESKNAQTFVVTIDSNGDVVAQPPSDATNIQVTPAAAGAVRVRAEYDYEADPAAIEADTWAVWITTDGSTPDADNDPATQTETMRKADGTARLDWTSSTFSTGLAAKVIVRPRRSSDSVDATDATVYTTTTNTSGPSQVDPAAALLVPGAPDGYGMGAAR